MNTDRTSRLEIAAMSSSGTHAFLLLLIPAVGLAQSVRPDSSDPSSWSPPPLLEAPGDAPRAADSGPSTPPPPGSTPPPADTTSTSPGYIPAPYRGTSYG